MERFRKASALDRHLVEILQREYPHRLRFEGRDAIDRRQRARHGRDARYVVLHGGAADGLLIEE